MAPGAPGKNTPRKPVRLIDIATKAGVSRTAVANVVLKSAGGNVRVSPETADRIRRVARELSYSPNAAAQRLAGKRTRIIGTIIDSYAPTPRFKQLSEVERAASERGYRVMVGQSHGEIDKIERYADDFIANRVDGVVCISHHYPDIGKRIAGVFMRIPNVVFLGQPLAGQQRSHWVATDHRGAMRKLVSHFIESGRKHIALCLTDATYQDSIDRQAGYADALHDHGLKPEVGRVLSLPDDHWAGQAPSSSDSISEWMEQRLSEGPIDAILALNDVMAMHLVRALHKLGKRVPEDMAVAGYDNLAMASVTMPSLTTVDQRDREVARRGFEMMLKLIEGEQIEPDLRHQWVEPEIILRESG